MADNDLEKIHVISNRADLEKTHFSPDTKLALLNQTTLSVDDTKYLITEVQLKHPQVVLP